MTQARSFKTSGNASITLLRGDMPLLTTDPWLIGRAYFDSWALHHSYSDADLQEILASTYLWISHGHPDHFHPESLALFEKGKKLFLPDHYHQELADSARNMGFDVHILPYRQWVRVENDLELCCLDNFNQDAILLMRFGDALLVNQNDSPFCGDKGFIKRIVEAHPNHKRFIFRLIGVSADMLNFVDKDNNRITDQPESYKPGAIGENSRNIQHLGIRYFCCSSSQHQFARSDSIWANAYDMTPDDMRTHWQADDVQVIDPFSHVQLDDLSVTPLADWRTPEVALQHNTTAADDWAAKLNTDDWQCVKAFFSKFETIRDIVDFIDIDVADVRERIQFHPSRTSRGVRFRLPKKSLMDTIEYGYFDDLLIANFMQTELINMRLYPDFSPRIAKYAGNAKIYSKRQLRGFFWHYIRRNPLGVIGFLASTYWRARLVRDIADLAEKLGVKKPLKFIYNMVRG